MSDEKPVKKVIQKPLNPLAAKPGQNYGSTKYVPTKEYEGGQITFKTEAEKAADEKAEAEKKNEK
ncbi:MAG: hypothetical protein P4M01_01805 [Acidobacteriota bacterium]|nr:hypothetical protein [Acidobacteriota bacterium]